MIRTVVYSPRAKQQLTELYLWIVEQSGFPQHATGYVSAIIDYCDALAEFPYRGVARDDLRPGLRTIGFRKRVMIAFAVHAETVEVLGVYYGGQDFQGLLSAEAD